MEIPIKIPQKTILLMFNVNALLTTQSFGLEEASLDGPPTLIGFQLNCWSRVYYAITET